MKNKVYFYSSPIGILEIKLKDNKIYSISKTRLKEKSANKEEPLAVYSLRRKLDRYFSGKKILKWNLRLYPQGTPFQNKVWNHLRKIPYGKTMTYSQIAKKIHHPQAIRAIGSACGKNPWLITTPCHRAIAKNGLGGFALGLKIKRQILQTENIKIPLK